jgi:hypothetical protein
LPNNASINVQFLFGVQQEGVYRVVLVPEGLPRGGGIGDAVVIEGCFPNNCAKDVFGDGYE